MNNTSDEKFKNLEDENIKKSYNCFNNKNKNLEVDKLISKKEFLLKVNEFRKTGIGKLFPFLSAEIPRLTIICLNYIFVSFIYSFMKCSKELIICRELDLNVLTWLRIISFFVSVHFVEYSSYVFRKYGSYNGILKYNKYLCYILTSLIFLILFDKFVWRRFVDGFCEIALSSSALSIRNLDWIVYPLSLIANFVMAFFYVLYETMGSNLISVVFGLFMTTFLTSESYKRYFCILYISINLTTGLTSYFVEKIVNLAKSVPNAYFFLIYILFCIICILMLTMLSFLNYFMKNICSKSLYKESLDEMNSTDLKSKCSSDVKNLTFFQIFKLLYHSKIILSLSVIAFSYSFLESIFSLYGGFLFKVAGDFFSLNPSFKSGFSFIPTVSNIRFKSSTIETFFSSVLTSIVVILPYNRTIVELYGILYHGYTTIIFGILSTISMIYFSMVNYPFSSQTNKAVLGGFKINSLVPQFKKEVDFYTVFTSLLKASKYTCYDVVKEYVYIVIDPVDRVIFKGISEGIFAKAGKLVSSFIIIFFNAIFGSNMSYFVMIIVVMNYFIFLVYALSINFICKRYLVATKKNRYITEKL